MAKLSTTLSINASPASAEIPFTVQITGQLKAILPWYVGRPPQPLSGKPIELYRNGVYVKKTTTGTDGRYSFTDAISSKGTHAYYARFAGDASYYGD